MRFTCALALLAVLHGAELVSGLDSVTTQVILDHGATSRLVRVQQHDQDEQDALLEHQYLPKKYRHADDMLDAYRKRQTEALGSLSDDILVHLPDDESCLVFDVGANVGTFTDEVVAKRPSCKVVAFDPVEEISSYLIDRHQNNPKVVVEEMAVSDLSGAKIFYKSTSSDFDASSSLTKSSPDQTPEKVTATSLTDYVHTHGLASSQVHAVKVDVSSGEWRVLSGMRSLLQVSKQPPMILMTIGAGKEESQERNQEKEEIEWLFAHGYKRINYKAGVAQDLLLMPNAPYVPPAQHRLAPSPRTVAVMRVWFVCFGISMALMALVCVVKNRQDKKRQAPSVPARA